MATTVQRRKLSELMDVMVAHEPRVHYGQIRPMRSRSIKTTTQLMVAMGTSLTLDCSESVTLLCRLSGLHDPNGQAYNGTGNTQMMFDHLTHYKLPTMAAIGALVFFGIPDELSTQHITMVRHTGKDPVLFSHGQERGPLWINLSMERQYHQGEPVFLSIAKL